MQYNFKHLALTCALFLTALSLCLSNPNLAKASLSNYDAAPLGSVNQPAKGATYTDPAFGTKVLRVTDSNDAVSATVAYSYWPTFNYNSTKMVIALQYTPYLYNFDPNNLSFQKIGPMFSNDAMQFEGLSWSVDDANTIYGVSGNNSNTLLRAYNVNTKQYTFVHDFTATGELPIGSPKQMSKARSNDRYFSFHWYPAGSSVARYAVVYDKQLNKTYLFDLQASYGMTNFDECRLDRDGNFLTILTGVESYVWKFATQQPNQRTVIAYNGTERSGGHYDIGSGKLVHSDLWGNNGNKVIDTNLNSPATWSPVFDSGVSDWSTSHHFSMLGPNDNWVLITTMTTPANFSVPFTNEVYLAKTDGSGSVIRLVHPNSSNNCYETLPFANISPDGRFIAYNSDWNGGHCDVYIAVVPEGIWGTGSTPASNPTAQATANINLGTVPLSVIFDGSASSSPNGTITNYSWNFGDGTTAQGASVSHLYPLVGSFNAVLTVTDSAGKTATSSNIAITVSAALGNPTASFTTNVTTGNAPLSVSFNGSASSSPNGSINNYSWNFGDGTSGNGANVSHTFNAAGSFNAVLTVTDSAGKTASTSKTITVNSSSGGSTGTTTVTLNLYSGDGKQGSMTRDITISSSSPTSTTVTNGNNRIGSSSKNSMLIAFPNLIGSGNGQIPVGAKIVSAKLTLSLVSSQSMDINIARILDADNKGMWGNSSATGNNVGACYNMRNAAAGVKWSNNAANLSQSMLALTPSTITAGQTLLSIDVTSSVAAWLAGAANQGWWLSTASNNLTTIFDSSSSTASKRPVLTVVYTK